VEGRTGFFMVWQKSMDKTRINACREPVVTFDGRPSQKSRFGMSIAEVMIAYTVVLVAFLGLTACLYVANQTKDTAEDIKKVYNATHFWHDLLQGQPYHTILAQNGRSDWAGYKLKDGIELRYVVYVSQVNMDMLRLETVMFHDKDDDHEYDENEFRMRMVSYKVKAWFD